MLRMDLVAGVTLAAYAIPVAMGNASLANLPPAAGLNACLAAGLVFWLFSSSRYTAINVTSAVALLVGATLGDMAGGDPARFAALAGATALLTGLLALLVWLLRAGTLVDFVSESVLLGLKAGTALYLAVTQLPRLLGFPGSGSDDFVEMSAHLVSHFGEARPASLAVGLGALAALITGRLLWRNGPVALIVVAGAIAAAMLCDLGPQGVALVGEVPQRLPDAGLPGAIDWRDPAAVRRDLNGLLPLALACLLLSAVDTTSSGRMLAARRGGRFDNNQEFLALAAANFAAGLGRGLPVTGSMGASLVAEAAGARSPLSGLVAALMIVLVIACFAPLLERLPQPALAAIVLSAIAGLVNVTALRMLWRSHRGEFLVAAAAFAGVLGAGMLNGVLIGAVVSLALVLRQAARPHVALLGRVPGSRRFSDLAHHPANERVPAVLVVRPESGLVYFNAAHVRDSVLARVRAQPTLPGLVLLDLSATPRIDLQSVGTLAALADALAAADVRLQVVEARASVRAALRGAGLEQRLGPIDHLTGVADALDAFESMRRSR